MPLPAPRLMSIYPEKNGSYVVAWKEVKDMGNEKYVLSQMCAIALTSFVHSFLLFYNVSTSNSLIT